MRTFKVYSFAFVILVCLALSPRAETLVALLSDKTLRHIDSVSPSAWLKTVNITGIPDTDSVAALDFRPDGSLVVFGRDATTVRPYTVDPNTGAAVASPFLGIPVGGTTAIAFNAFASETHSENLALLGDDDMLHRFSFTSSGNSGGVATIPLFYDNSAADGDPVDIHSGATPSIVALGSTNSFPGARSSVLYGVDSDQDSLVKINWGNGSMDTVATLRTGGNTLNVATRTGFDISAVTGIAYLSRPQLDPTELYTVDLTTGQATEVGIIGPQFQQAGVTVVDIATLPPTAVANISTRSKVGTGDEVMIAGFIAQGGAPARLIIRGIGPSLSAFGVPNALADPVLTVFDGNGVQIAVNDSWKSDQQTEITATKLAPSNDAEAAYVGTFAPGQYTAKVSGNNGGTGVGLVEIYRLPDL